MTTAQHDPVYEGAQKEKNLRKQVKIARMAAIQGWRAALAYKASETKEAEEIMREENLPEWLIQGVLKEPW